MVQIRLDGIDLLRGLAVSFVIIYHFFVLLGLNGSPLFTYVHSFGVLGVSLFFVISGYLIYRSIDYSTNEYGVFKGLKHYAVHRAFRIIPAYYFNFFIVLLMATSMIDSTYLYSYSFVKQLLAHLTFTSYFLYQDSGLGINGAYWTLSIEMLWYIVAPVLLLFVKKKRFLIILLLMSFVYFAALDKGMLDAVFHLNHEEASYILKLYFFSFQLPGQLAYFIAGILIYKYSYVSVKLSPVSRYAFSVALIILFMYISRTYELHTTFLIHNLFILVSVSVLFLLLYATMPKRMQIFEWLGKISYSLYLWHMPLLYVMKQTSVLTHIPLLIAVALFVAVLLLISSFSYYFIEESGFRLRKKFEK